MGNTSDSGSDGFELIQESSKTTTTTTTAISDPKNDCKETLKRKMEDGMEVDNQVKKEPQCCSCHCHREKKDSTLSGNNVEAKKDTSMPDYLQPFETGVVVDLNQWLPKYITYMDSIGATTKEKIKNALSILWNATLTIRTSTSTTIAGRYNVLNPNFSYPITRTQFYQILVDIYGMSMEDMSKYLIKRDDKVIEEFPLNVMKPTIIKLFFRNLVNQSTNGSTKSKDPGYEILKFIALFNCQDFDNKLMEDLMKTFINDPDQVNCQETLELLFEYYNKYYFCGDSVISGSMFIVDDGDIEYNFRETKEGAIAKCFLKLGFSNHSWVDSRLVSIVGGTVDCYSSGYYKE
ncbi:hypothetical protein H4219_005621 [Mycoemilia scoparia]|uniref:Uncharacterized protein n=1 Tax=Mycoemilia scoparia TaxID=417184 RepID=A0A9W8DKS0_9FUNG|nr:hypothetical protein H4219_005621 [Mycoemilia scoparia]